VCRLHTGNIFAADTPKGFASRRLPLQEKGNTAAGTAASAGLVEEGDKWPYQGEIVLIDRAQL
jgi:hypothetical protein